MLSRNLNQAKKILFTYKTSDFKRLASKILSNIEKEKVDYYIASQQMFLSELIFVEKDIANNIATKLLNKNLLVNGIEKEIADYLLENFNMKTIMLSCWEDLSVKKIENSLIVETSSHIAITPEEDFMVSNLPTIKNWNFELVTETEAKNYAITGELKNSFTIFLGGE